MKICSSCKVAEAASSDTYCKPCRSIRNAAYHKAHPEKSRQTSKKYDKANRHKRRVHEEKYKKSKPDKVREWGRRKNRKREALRRNNGHVPYSEKQVLDTYGVVCHICKTDIDLSAPRQCGKPGWQKGLQIDHLIPISKGGPDMLENVRPSHGKCNIDKKANLVY
jgi:5-methylcytosine-specific restriction endonuclease McrA